MEVTMNMIIIFISSSLALLFPLISFLHKVWWTPLRIQRQMRSQGIKGPSYKFLYGTTTEMNSLMAGSTDSPMDFSHDILPRLQPHIYTWVKLYGNNVLSWYGSRPQLVVTDPELVKEIFTNDKAYPRVEIPSYVKKLIGDGTFASQGEKWAKLRKIANHAFYTESVRVSELGGRKPMVPAIIAGIETMLERWRQYEGKEIDIYDEFRVMTSEVIARTAFRSNYKEGEQIFDMLKKLGAIISRRRFRVRFPLIGKFMKTNEEIEEDKLDKEISDSIRSVVKEREAQMKSGNEDGPPSDMLGLLIMASHDTDEKKRVLEQEIIDECKTVYNSGQESTASLLTWAALLLAIHTDWQEKVRTEVFEVFGKDTPSAEKIPKLKIISMIINETLRLYPPVIHVARTTISETKLGKFVLPANLELLLPPLALHHDPKVWGEDAHLFKPERFEEGVAKATNGNSMVFLPFGYGPRFCVGKNFAITEVKIMLSMILQRYKLTLSPSYVHAPVKVLTVRPQHGAPVTIHPI